MKNQAQTIRLVVVSAHLCSALMVLPAIAQAQSTPDDWRFRASLYGYFPNIGGSARLPTGAGADIDIAAEDLIENLKFGTMGSFEAQKGRWGGFADLIYLNVGDSVHDTRSLAAGSMPLPPGITADASLDIEATSLTLGVNYRAIDAAKANVDVFAGARLLDAKTELGWGFNTDFGPFSGPARQGRAEASRDFWDGIVGIKGARKFGSASQWFVPYYFDAGTGDSDFTWQASVGIGYATRWGELFATWRHLDYSFKSDSAIEGLDFDGPTLGFAISW